ncbi:Eae protein [Salmonella enterica]|nr:Eae protein [Salmonella enterica subsp. salamae]EKN4989709.1 Eae protein [Salmonella enterica]
MKEVKIYTIVSDQLSPPITGESFCTDMVRHSDYAELEDKYAALAEVRESARNEGINYAASRLAAAFNHGFLDKPVSEVLDVTRMILSAKEDLANDPLPADDGLSGEYAEKAIEEWADQLRKGAAL